MKKRFILSLAFACVLASCSTANVSGQAGSFATFATPQSGSVSGGSVGVNIQGAPAAGVVVTAAVIAALIGVWRDSTAPLAEPRMLEDRAISEADCAQPIADWSKNLKCK